MSPARSPAGSCTWTASLPSPIRNSVERRAGRRHEGEPVRSATSPADHRLYDDVVDEHREVGSTSLVSARHRSRDRCRCPGERRRLIDTEPLRVKAFPVRANWASAMRPSPARRSRRRRQISCIRPQQAGRRPGCSPEKIREPRGDLVVVERHRARAVRERTPSAAIEKARRLQDCRQDDPNAGGKIGFRADVGIDVGGELLQSRDLGGVGGPSECTPREGLNELQRAGVLAGGRRVARQQLGEVRDRARGQRFGGVAVLLCMSAFDRRSDFVEQRSTASSSENVVARSDVSPRRSRIVLLYSCAEPPHRQGPVRSASPPAHPCRPPCRRRAPRCRRSPRCRGSRSLPPLTDPEPVPVPVLAAVPVPFSRSGGSGSPPPVFRLAASSDPINPRAPAQAVSATPTTTEHFRQVRFVMGSYRQ